MVAVKTSNVQDQISIGYILRLYNLKTGICLRNLYGHESRITSINFDSKKIVSGDESGNVMVWNKRSSEETPTNILSISNCQKVAGIVFDSSPGQRGMFLGMQKGSLMYLDFHEAKR